MSNKYFYLFIIIFSASCFAVEPSESKLQTIYNSLDPTSISQHLAFYELYSKRPLGKQALRDAWQLLAGRPIIQNQLSDDIPLSSSVTYALISLVNKPLDQQLNILDEETLRTLTKLSQRLPHTKLKGHAVWNEKEVLELPLEEIDLARGLFLSQFGPDRQRIQSYEAMIDLMALQVLARLPQGATPEQKIRVINAFIFDEMGFRFPPHSLMSKDIDVYTYLPSVLDSHRGVCLGVSILYICLAQRLSLSLEMITPPGHIYVRYRSGNKIINIETTARGIHLDCEEYLSVSTCALQQRTIREVIGMAHYNQASAYWRQSAYDKALAAYQKAFPYMADDPKLKELMAYTLLLTGKKEEGEQLLWEIKDVLQSHEIVKGTTVDDYLLGNVDKEGIAVLFSKEEEDRQSILAKKELLEKTVQRCPRFRAGLLCLAVTWMQLHRVGEAVEALKTYQLLDRREPEVHYYLSMLYAQRHDYPMAWYHLKEAESIVKIKNHAPKDLKELRRELLKCCPE